MKNKQKYWFKRRRYGYGWTPTTWEGWLATIAFIFSLIMVSAAFIRMNSLPFALFAIVGINIIILYRKGPKPKWRWGKKPGDNPKLDF